MKDKFRKVDALGRVVLPVELRRQVGLDAGAEFTTELVDGAIVVKPVGTKSCWHCKGTGRVDH